MSTLFLENSLSISSRVSVSLHEAYAMMLEAAQMSEALTEGLYTADFSIHLQESTGALTEEEAEKKKGNLLKNAAIAIKDFIIKVKDSVIAFLTKISDAIKARIKKFRGPYVKIVKGGLAELEDFYKVLNKYFGLVNANIKNVEEYNSTIEKFLQTEYHPKQKSITETFAKSKKDGNTEEVKVSELNKIVAWANVFSGEAQNAKVRLDASVKEVLAATAEADTAFAKLDDKAKGGEAGDKYDEAKKKANEVIKAGRSSAKHFHQYAQATGWFSTLVSKAIVGATTETDDE